MIKYHLLNDEQHFENNILSMYPIVCFRMVHGIIWEKIYNDPQ